MLEKIKRLKKFNFEIKLKMKNIFYLIYEFMDLKLRSKILKFVKS